MWLALYFYGGYVAETGRRVGQLSYFHSSYRYARHLSSTGGMGLIDTYGVRHNCNYKEGFSFGQEYAYGCTLGTYRFHYRGARIKKDGRQMTSTKGVTSCAICQGIFVTGRRTERYFCFGVLWYYFLILNGVTSLLLDGFSIVSHLFECEYRGLLGLLVAWSRLFQ